MGSRLFVAVFCLEDPSPGTHISFDWARLSSGPVTAS
jgi:hypothetical protein